MTIRSQVRRLEELGVPNLAGITVEKLHAYARPLAEAPNAVLAVHPSLVAAHRLAPLLSRNDKPGFVVADMIDLDQFVDHEPFVTVPDRPLYLLTDVDRGDDMRNWSPDEALPAIVHAARSPLTISEGICWLFQEPKALQPNYCFMTIGSRKRTKRGLDARTPAIWISGGAGRDGTASAGAPKVGWCWAGNRHTWLGFASTGRRI